LVQGNQWLGIAELQRDFTIFVALFAKRSVAERKHSITNWTQELVAELYIKAALILLLAKS